MTEKASVIKILENKIIVSCYSNSDCKNCSACNASGKIREINVLNPKKIALSPGDEVIITLPASQTILSSFLVLIFPLLLFIFSYIISGKINGAEEGIRALFGIAGMFVGFFISFFLSKILKSKFMPYISSKLSK